MKAPAQLVLIALFAFLVPFATFAANADVMVVVNGNTEVNREAYNYIRKTFQYNNINYSVTATLDPSTVKAGQYKTVVVLNTGTSSGVDPVLQKFINGYADKKSLYLVNLYRGKTDLTVTTFAAASNAEGVDGVSAASTWMRGFGSSQSIQDMHLAWVKALVKFLQRS
jgi:hypothetical protein